MDVYQIGIGKVHIHNHLIVAEDIDSCFIQAKELLKKFDEGTEIREIVYLGDLE